MSDVPARRAESPADQPPTSPRGSAASGPRGELPPPQDPFLTEGDALPVAPDALGPAGSAAPGSTRRPRVVHALPIWVLVALGALVIVVGLLIVPSIAPWSRAPIESPLGDGVPAIGEIGNETAADPAAAATSPSPSAEPTARAAATPGAGPTQGADVTSGPSAPAEAPPPGNPPAPSPADPGPADPSSAPTPPPGLEIAQFGAVAWPEGGYRVTVEIANRSTVAQDWHNVAVTISTWAPSVEVWEPRNTVRAFPGVGRICLAPTDADAARLGAGRSLTIVFWTSAPVATSVRTVRLNDGEGCASAES